MHFCVILTLNNAYYQVREAETQAFYELFRIELESRNLEELLRRFLESLVHVCHADAGRLYMLNEDASEWVLRAGSPIRRHCGSESPRTDQEALEATPFEWRSRASRASCSMKLAQPLQVLLVDSAGDRRPHRRRHAVRIHASL